MFFKKVANKAVIAGLISIVSAVALSKPAQAEICIFDFLCIRDTDIGGSREAGNSDRPNEITSTRESSTTSQRVRSVRFNVPANQTWVDTEIVVQRGEVISITAIGQWSNGGDNPQYVSANGYDFYHPDAIESSIPFASLIGSVGNRESFEVGQNRTVAMTDSGTLYLRMNDILGSFRDNQGSIRVEIVARYES